MFFSSVFGSNGYLYPFFIFLQKVQYMESIVDCIIFIVYYSDVLWSHDWFKLGV